LAKTREQNAGIFNTYDLKKTGGKLIYGIMVAILILAGIVALFPSIWIFMMGLKDTQEIYANTSFFSENLTWTVFVERLAEAIQLVEFWKMSFNTLLVSLGSVAMTLFVSGMGGYVISRLKPRGTKLIFILIVWTMMMPGQIRTVPLFISYLSFPFVAEIPGEVSLINTYWPMWLGAAASCFNIILFKNQFDSISISLVEAAKIDGCGNGRIFFNIMLPLSVPTILYISIVTMQGAWSEFFNGYLVLTERSIQTLPVRVFVTSTAQGVKQNTYMLCLILSSLPMLILFMLFHRQMIGGANVGGVKG